ncbi:MAG: hypothetical protein JEZ12_17910 [Desulfobacterium sp.]|nr:hypothetical protein [Desulfobacterium sp.]
MHLSVLVGGRILGGRAGDGRNSCARGVHGDKRKKAVESFNSLNGFPIYGAEGEI